jgi:hypothetical protein
VHNYEKANDDELVFKLDPNKVFDEDRMFKPEVVNGELIHRIEAYGYTFLLCKLDRLPYKDGIFEDVRDAFDDGYLSLTYTVHETNDVMVIINKAIDALGGEFYRLIFGYASSIFTVLDKNETTLDEDGVKELLRELPSSIRSKLGDEVYDRFIDTARQNNVKLHIKSVIIDFAA